MIIEMPNEKKSFLHRYKPGVSRRVLLFIAGCAWTIAGGILMTRGLMSEIASHHLLLLKLVCGAIAGIAFYLVLFSRISSKHISRIKMIKIEDPCFFSFFNFRSYLLMAVMITGGISLRKLNVINPEILYTFFLSMGLPLLISAYRFFYSWAKNRSHV
jgi:hypothetical protein